MAPFLFKALSIHYFIVRYQQIMTMNYDKNPTDNDAFIGLKFWTGVAIIMVLVAEMIQTLLNGEPAFMAFAPDDNWMDWLNFIGSFAGIPACLMWLGGKRVPIKAIWSKLALSIGFGIYAYLMLFNNAEGLHASITVITMVLGPLGILSVIFVPATHIVNRNTLHKKWSSLYWRIALLLGALSVSTNAALASNRLIFPATWDYFVYRIDSAFGGIATQTASLNSMGSPFLQAFTTTMYTLLIIFFYVMVGLAMRKRQMAKLHVWRTLVVPFAIAWFLYALLPLSGPAYAFFDSQFPNDMPAAVKVMASQVVIPPAYRNAMPSMHLTGALLIWMLSIGLRHRIAILFSSLFVFSTVWATMATGEHYLLDLVVAVPYSAFIGTALIWPQLFRGNRKVVAVIWLSGVNFLAWLILLRIAPIWLSEHPLFVRLFSVWCLICSANVFWGMVLTACGCEFSSNIKVNTVRPNNNLVLSNIKAPAWVIGIFVVSGLAGLIYEVVYAKALAVTFGSTALASYTVLATYMGGMAFGAWLGGYVADQARNSLQMYAACEALIGLYAATTPKLFELIQNIYVFFSLDAEPDSGLLTLLRLGLGTICLGLPTVLMGATMPLMFKYLRGLGVSSRGAIAPLYGANVAGAAIGSIIAGYWILPAVGRNGGTYIAAVLSLIVALYVLNRAKSMLVFVNVFTAERDIQYNQTKAKSVDSSIGLTSLGILFVGGVVTLGLEVNSMHLLAVVAGNSVYAFGLMLATFLGGLGLGSYAGERLMAHFSRIDLVAWSQCGVAFAIGLTAQSWDDIPSYFASFSIYPISLTFGARETIRAMVCATAMVPPAFFIGMSYPAAMSLASDWLSPYGGAKGLGVASGINTLGNILGVMLIGFWLLPAFGSRNSAFVLALMALLLGLLALIVNKQKPSTTVNTLNVKNTMRWAPLLVACSSLSAFPKQLNYDDLATGSNVYFSAQNWGKVIDHEESVEGGLTLVTKNQDGVYTLLTNGKFQGNDSSGGEMVAQESFALFPLLHTQQRDAALVIGYGTGMTTRVLHDAGFKRIDVAELSKDITQMANRYFEKINHAVTDQPNVALHFTDGRNFLLTQSHLFNLISIEITSIWFAGAANLYNQEFYALAKTRLRSNGVLQQWVQLHHIAPIDLAYIIGSVRSEFRYVWLYVRGGQGIIVASNNYEVINFSSFHQQKYKKFLAGYGTQIGNLKSFLILSPAGIDRLISGFDPSMNLIVSSDNNLYLEHSTPKGNALGDVLEKNIRLLSSYEPTQLQAPKKVSVPDALIRASH